MSDCTRRPVVLAAAIGLVMLVAGSPTGHAQTLKAVKERGTLNCGVSQGLLGFSSMDDKNVWAGFDVDICRARGGGDLRRSRQGDVHAARCGGPLHGAAVQQDRRAVAQLDLDDVARELARPDVRRRRLLRRPGFSGAPGEPESTPRLQLGGKTVCTQTGTTSELNLADYFRANEMPLKVLALGTAEESRKAYDDRKCDVLTSDVSQLYAERLKLAAPDSHIILPEVISKEPLGPAVRQGDDQWFNLVKWTLYALINAEELGVKSATIDDAVKSANPNIRRLVGTEGEFGAATGPCERLGRACRSRGRQLRRDL